MRTLKFAYSTHFGLGDAAHTVFHPIAKTIDRVARTKLANCGGCDQRRTALNRAVPNVIPPFLRDSRPKIGHKTPNASSKP